MNCEVDGEGWSNITIPYRYTLEMELGKDLISATYHLPGIRVTTTSCLRRTLPLASDDSNGVHRLKGVKVIRYSSTLSSQDEALLMALDDHMEEILTYRHDLLDEGVLYREWKACAQLPPPSTSSDNSSDLPSPSFSLERIIPIIREHRATRNRSPVDPSDPIFALGGGIDPWKAVYRGNIELLHSFLLQRVIGGNPPKGEVMMEKVMKVKWEMDRMFEVWIHNHENSELTISEDTAEVAHRELLRAVSVTRKALEYASPSHQSHSYSTRSNPKLPCDHPPSSFQIASDLDPHDTVFHWISEDGFPNANTRSMKNRRLSYNRYVAFVLGGIPHESPLSFRQFGWMLGAFTSMSVM